MHAQSLVLSASSSLAALPAPPPPLTSTPPVCLKSFEVESCERLRHLPDELSVLTQLERIRLR